MSSAKMSSKPTPPNGDLPSGPAGRKPPIFSFPFLSFPFPLSFLFLGFETGSHYIAQASLELSNPSASASQVLRLQVCTTTPFLRG
jgi:hypothetical protein